MKIAGIVLLILLVGVGIWYAVSSGGYDNANSTTNAPAVGDGAVEPVDFTIVASEYSYTPNALTIVAGQTVKIRVQNQGTMTHNFLIDELNVTSGLIAAGDANVVSLTAPEEPGTYTFYCSVGNHRLEGLTGTLTVVAAE